MFAHIDLFALLAASGFAGVVVADGLTAFFPAVGANPENALGSRSNLCLLARSIPND
mgnify:CR=1 FL=1